MSRLSVVIPSKNEPYLEKTVEGLKRACTGDTEVLFLEDVGIGQRATTSELVRRATGDFIMKVDAHVQFAHGFDIAMLAEIDDKTILAPLMGVLEPISWTINGKKMMSRYCFDTNLIMQYDVENGNPETMCLQGSAWMTLKKNYWDWNLGDESMPSWGGQGAELGIKAFLNGGRCVTTRSTYYGHVFRHSGADFPYDRGANPGQRANEVLKQRYLNKSIAPLIQKFNYPADWTAEKVAEL